jgi:acyl dehydratase
MVEEKMTPKEKAVFEEWKGKVGQEFIPPPVEEAYSRYEESPVFFRWGEEADWSAIKKWAIINEDYNALWFDEEYAKKSRWGGMIAPPLYLLSCSNGGEWSFELHMYLLKHRSQLPNFIGVFVAGVEWEFFEPVRPGDRINSKNKLADLYWKQGKEHRLLFLVGESTLTNQKGQLLATVKQSDVYTFK